MSRLVLIHLFLLLLVLCSCQRTCAQNRSQIFWFTGRQKTAGTTP